MGNTKKGRDVRLADRWLAANGGGLPPLDPGAHALLGARLVARRRALLISSPLLLVAAALNATRLYRISTRPTLAVDPTALAVDEQLRADGAVNAVRTLVPITMIPFGQVMPSASQPNSWVWFCWMAGSLVIVTTWIWAAMEPRWPGSPIAGWPPSRDGGTGGDPVALPSAGPGAGPWSGGEGR